MTFEVDNIFFVLYLLDSETKRSRELFFMLIDYVHVVVVHREQNVAMK